MRHSGKPMYHKNKNKKNKSVHQRNVQSIQKKIIASEEGIITTVERMERATTLEVYTLWANIFLVFEDLCGVTLLSRTPPKVKGLGPTFRKNLQKFEYHNKISKKSS